MKRLLSFIILFNSYCCLAQNYNCLQGDVKHFFTNSNGYLRWISIDSVRSAGADTIYYPYKTYRLNYLIPDNSNGSWLGSRVIKQADGTFLFNTAWNDTIVIKTQAQPGDSWTFHNDTSSRSYIATLVSTDTMTFMGISDSVKRIKIACYVGGTLNTADSINNFEILLSKNNGFVKAFDLYLFPYHNPGTTVFSTSLDPYLQELTSGASGSISASRFMFSVINYHLPTELEIFDFNVGDVFVIGSGDYCLYAAGHFSQRFDSIVAKTIVDPFHVRYTTASRWKSCLVDAIGTHGPYTYGSGTGFIDADTSIFEDFLKMPEDINSFKEAWYYLPNDTSFCTTSTFFLHKNIIVFEGCDYIVSYKVGFEQIEESKNDFSCGSPSAMGCDHIWGHGLQYSVKDGIPCGTPIYVGVDDEPTIKTGCTLYPNPVTGILHISAPVKISSVSIHNITGQVVYSGEFTADDVTINVAELPHGMYFVKVNNVEVRKFVKM